MIRLLHKDSILAGLAHLINGCAISFALFVVWNIARGTWALLSA